MVSVSVLNVALSLIVACGSGDVFHVPRFQRLLRPFFLVAHFRNVQKVFLAMVTAAPKIGKALLLLVFEILVFAVFAFVFFHDFSVGDDGLRDGRSTADTCYAPKQPALTPTVGCSSYFQSCTNYFSTVHEVRLLTLRSRMVAYPPLSTPSALPFVMLCFMPLMFCMHAHMHARLLACRHFISFSSWSRQRISPTLCFLRKAVIYFAHAIVFIATCHPRPPVCESRRSLLNCNNTKVLLQPVVLALLRSFPGYWAPFPHESCTSRGLHSVPGGEVCRFVQVGRYW
jgi:hypothetical protein